MKKRSTKFSVTTKLSGEEFLLLEDLALREGKSRFQLMHDILMERLESEFGEIDYGIPSDWLPQPRARRTRRERNIRLMKAKAEELGIDLKERYDYGDTED